jgi:GNAT superfamily N-acetyltransferase
MKEDKGDTARRATQATEAAMMTAPVQFSQIYGFVRGRQLEGTYPGDPATGTWGSTRFRVGRGWGAVPESEWPYPKSTDPWPPTEPPGLDAKAKQYRILFYQRVTNSYECKLALPRHNLVVASFEITKQWDDANGGVIEVPAEGAEIIGSHAIRIVGYDDAKGRFTFANSWGTTWGDKGYGYLPYEFFDQELIEAWVAAGTGQRPPSQPTTGIAEVRWAIPDYAGRIFHAREFYDADADERIGWAFAVQGQDYLDVEELYVRPQFRRQRYGTSLLRSLKDLSTQAGLPLEFYIPFADSKPENLSVVERLLFKERYFLFPSGLRWCSLVARQPVAVAELSLRLPSPPALISPRSRVIAEGLVLPATGDIAIGQPGQALPVSESIKLLKPVDGTAPAESFRRGWKEALRGETLPIDLLWEGIDVE